MAMLAGARRPLIVAGGGIVNADATDCRRVRRAGRHPFIHHPDGVGVIPDDIRLMAVWPVCRPRTATDPRFWRRTSCSGSGTVGTDNRWAGHLYQVGRTFRARRQSTHQMGGLRTTTASSLTPGRRWSCSCRSPASNACLTAPPGWRSAPSASDDAAAHPLRGRADQPQRVYQEMNARLRAGHPLRPPRSAVPDRRSKFLHVYKPRTGSTRSGRPARLDAAAALASVRPPRRDGGRLSGTTIPVNDRGAGGPVPSSTWPTYTSW